MASISGFEVLETLHESANSHVFRARREADGQGVVVKMLTDAYPSPQRVAWFRREYEITRSLAEVEGVIDTIDFVASQDRWLLVLEDLGAHSLASLGATLSHARLLEFVVQLVETLGELHRRRVIHKDLNPSNIVLNPERGVLKLIDFGISSVLSRESSSMRAPSNLEGTLAYLSPEQTGRMNRAIDYRTDYYSLGITLYELFTGVRPFTDSDPMGLVHAHIARLPRSPHELDERIDPALSGIILKLLAKNAEDRYQSARGLAADLRACCERAASGRRNEPFVLARDDVSDRFEPPQKLYGRDEEQAMLLAAFERATSGSSQLVLVSGYSGVGKSALVRSLYKPITQRRGYFIAGKFDLLQRDVPYAPLIQAFRDLLRQTLADSEERLHAWRKRLTAALGDHGQVIIDVLPELELVIGPQPPAPPLAPSEAQNRFRLLFQRLISAVARPEHPLALFVDDLQWVDGASLDLLQVLLEAADGDHLLVIGAYRDNEVGPGHPLMLTLGELTGEGRPITTIGLQPLSVGHVEELVADTLACSRASARPLAELLVIKTGGNPFFLNEFLKHLHTEGLLRFDFVSASWRFELDKIEACEVTDNVVELMAKKVLLLGERCQRALQLAACTGNVFELHTLALILECSPQEAAEALRDALAAGLVQPLDDTYKLTELEVVGLHETMTVRYRFAHDRVQQAAYSLFAEDERGPVHGRIGRLLLEGTPPQQRKERVFDIVAQLDRAPREGMSEEALVELAELNLLAGHRARASSAYEPAWHYLRVGVELLEAPLDGWRDHYALMLRLHEDAAEAACLCGEYEQMHRLLRAIDSRARTLLDRVKAFEVEIQSYAARELLVEGVHAGRRALQRLGIEIPEQPDLESVMAVAAEVLAAREGLEIEALIELPDMTDPNKLAAMDLMARLYIPAFNAAPLIFLLVVFNEVILSLRYGMTPSSARGFVAYGFILCEQGDIPTGNRFGHLARQLAKRYGQDEASVIFMHNWFVRPWQHDARGTIPPFFEAYKLALETGDLEFAALSLVGIMTQSTWSGEKLDAILEFGETYSATAERLKQELPKETIDVFWQAALCLSGRSEDPLRLVGRALDERERVPYYIETKNVTEMAFLHLNKLTCAYILGDYELAAECAEVTRAHVAGMPALLGQAVLGLYESLTALARGGSGDDQDARKRILDLVDANQAQLWAWAEHCPANFRHKHALVAAERARVCGDLAAARDGYDRAISLAHRSGHIQELAVANELAARFHRERGYAHLVRHYLREAHHAYQHWGALAKVRALQAQYPQELASAPVRGVSLGDTFESTRTTTDDHTNRTATPSVTQKLDLSTVIRASRAMAATGDLATLLSRVMATALENAGAERGTLILERNDRLLVKARASVTDERGVEMVSVELDDNEELCHGIVQYVARTLEIVVLDDAAHEGPFATNSYIEERGCRSVMCLPIVSRGALVAILYMENNETAGAFTADRVEVLKLLMAPAAISIENAVLKDLESQSGFHYQVGGTLAADSKSYVVRAADRELLTSVRRGAYCYVLNARQMGKSSLRVRTMGRLDPGEFACVSIDVSMLGGTRITTDQWYAGICRLLLGGLGLASEVNLRTWWRERVLLTPTQRLLELFDEVILRRVARHIVIFIDEIDSVRSLEFDVDDFFVLIRSLYNLRAEDERFERLTFALFGVASPRELMRGTHRTAINIGRAIPLSPLEFSDAGPLLAGLADKGRDAEAILRSVFSWTGGQPFFTQKLCELLQRDETNPEPGQEAPWVEKLIRREVIHNWELQDEPEHLRTIRDRLLGVGESVPALLHLYLDVYADREVTVDEELQELLLLTGLVVRAGHKLQVSNRIYREVFDHGWIEEQLARYATRTGGPQPGSEE